MPPLHDLLQQIRFHGAHTITSLEEGRTVSRTFDQLARDVDGAVKRLRGSGAVAGMRVGLLAANSYAWVVYDVAALSLGVVLVVFPEDTDPSRAGELAVTWDLGLMVHDTLPASGAQPWQLALIGEDLGSARPGVAIVSESPPLSLVFSSGSEGRLKCLEVDAPGVEDMIAEMGAMFPRIEGDRVFLFLPLSNFQQRVFAYAALQLGIDIALVRTPDLFRGLAKLRPTIVVAPPLFFETIEAQVRAVRGARRVIMELASWLLTWLPLSGVRQRLRARLFRKVHEALGGRMRIMITGMAPIRPATLRRFDAMGLPLFEAYGLTECGIVAWNTPRANRIGTVGRPAEPGSVTLASDGEVIVRKRHPLTRGYIGMDTDRRVYLGDGSIATGDIGHIDREGFLRLVGRKKEMIVTAGGHKVHPEVIELQVAQVLGVERVVAWAGGTPETVVAAHGIDLLVSAKLRTVALDASVRLAVRSVNQALPADARVRRVLVTPEELTVANGLLTRNMKVDRRRIVERFGARVAAEGVVP